jgi:hypothetical protein
LISTARNWQNAASSRDQWFIRVKFVWGGELGEKRLLLAIFENYWDIILCLHPNPPLFILLASSHVFTTSNRFKS